MPPKMSIDPERIKAQKINPPGWYKLKLVKFSPKPNKNDANRINYNGQFEILNPAGPDHVKMVFETMSDKMERHIIDILHGLGFHVEKDGSFPGKWVSDPKEPNNVEKMQYQGPLMGRVMECELGSKVYNGNESNKIRQCRCAIPDCATKFPDIKHQTNMLGKN